MAKHCFSLAENFHSFIARAKFVIKFMGKEHRLKPVF